MDRPYDSIPRQGEHLGRDVDEEPTTNVRAQEAVKPTADEPNADGVILCSYSQTEGHYRVRRWRNRSDVALEEGYEEIDRYPNDESLEGVEEAIPGEARFPVFENLESGEVYYDSEAVLSDNWTGDGRFDQVTFFDDEEAAAAYAESRQKASS